MQKYMRNPNFRFVFDDRLYFWRYRRFSKFSAIFSKNVYSYLMKEMRSQKTDLSFGIYAENEFRRFAWKIEIINILGGEGVDFQKNS